LGLFSLSNGIEFNILLQDVTNGFSWLLWHLVTRFSDIASPPASFANAWGLEAFATTWRGSLQRRAFAQRTVHAC